MNEKDIQSPLLEYYLSSPLNKVLRVAALVWSIMSGDPVYRRNGCSLRAAMGWRTSWWFASGWGEKTRLRAADQQPLSSGCLFLILTQGLFLSLLLEREEGRERHWCERVDELPLVEYMRRPGSGPQPKYVPWPGIEPTTFGYRQMLQPTEPHWPRFCLPLSLHHSNHPILRLHTQQVV